MALQQGSARMRQRTVLLVGIAVLLAALVLAVVLASLLTRGRHEVSPEMLKWKDRGTTKNLQEVILGRCYNYITAQHPELGNMDSLSWLTNCSQVSPRVSCYARFPGIYPWYNQSRERCRLTCTGINYESCPKRSECESNPGSVFWKMASKLFAETACGVVQVMLNGSAEAGAFRSNSIFGSIEVFNLDPDKVSEVHIWLMQDIGGPQRNSSFGAMDQEASCEDAVQLRKECGPCSDSLTL
ncbi:hypothetical protein DUI87_09393 [Hirundo rustica rustica]|uniref:ADP-ribosyl cyclase/cyclic ADP-ribose hydrolase 1 n=1 Tax=Hirundo rustica rustica TaxID=333673 RepID=A0A3M0KU55_HIRRU|nr:hypothetical protein DUI87_09393 [Hirundo rustica rustica]